MERHEDRTEEWVETKLAGLDQPADWTPDLESGISHLRQQRGAVKPPARTWVWVAAGVAITSGGLVAFPPTRAFASRCVEACGQLVRQTPAHSDPKLAPDFTLRDVNGQPVQLSSLRGKVVLLNFWATWCRPCTVEVPWFVEFERGYSDRGLVVLGVSLDEEGWEVVKPFAREHGINYRLVIGDDKVASLFGGVDSLPTTFLIDRDGRIAATHTGLVSKQLYEGGIRAALEE
jgi:cytochrome c biogenesis protein CcmG/thiol:disulfide interchange protein DsbE